MSFLKFRKLSTIISSNNLFSPFFYSSLSGALMLLMLISLMISHKFLRLSSFFSFVLYWFGFCCLDLTISIGLSLSSLMFLFLDQICYWNSLVSFYVSYCTFQFKNFYFIHFYNFFLFVDILTVHISISRFPLVVCVFL